MIMKKVLWKIKMIKFKIWKKHDQWSRNALIIVVGRYWLYLYLQRQMGYNFDKHKNFYYRFDLFRAGN